MATVFLYKLRYSFEGVDRHTYIEANSVEKAKTIGRILIGHRTGWMPKYKEINIEDCFELTHIVTWKSSQDNSR